MKKVMFVVLVLVAVLACLAVVTPLQASGPSPPIGGAEAIPLDFDGVMLPDPGAGAIIGLSLVLPLILLIIGFKTVQKRVSSIPRLLLCFMPSSGDFGHLMRTDVRTEGTGRILGCSDLGCSRLLTDDRQHELPGTTLASKTTSTDNLRHTIRSTFLCLRRLL